MPHYKDESDCLYWLDDDVFAYLLPVGCVPISEAEADAINRAAAQASDSKGIKLAEVNNAFEAATALLTAGYPPSEKDSWPDQKTEAMAWYADSSAPTPYLDLLASYRGIDPLLYRQKTVAKVIAYTEAAAYLIGTRQKYADEITAATSQADLDAIVPSFTIPGA